MPIVQPIPRARSAARPRPGRRRRRPRGRRTATGATGPGARTAARPAPGRPAARRSAAAIVAAPPSSEGNRSSCASRIAGLRRPTSGSCSRAGRRTGPAGPALRLASSRRDAVGVQPARDAASSASSVVSAPPSPAVIPLRPWKLKRGDVGEAARGTTAGTTRRRRRPRPPEEEAVAVRDRTQLVVVGRLAERVDGEDADGARGDRPPRPRRGPRPRCPAARRRTPASRRSTAPRGRWRGTCSRRRRPRRRAGAEDQQRQVQGAAAAGGRHGVRRPGGAAEPLLERRARRPSAGEPSAGEDLSDRGELCRPDGGLPEGDRIRHPRLLHGCLQCRSREPHGSPVRRDRWRSGAPGRPGDAGQITGGRPSRVIRSTVAHDIGPARAGVGAPPLQEAPWPTRSSEARSCTRATVSAIQTPR